MEDYFTGLLSARSLPHGVGVAVGREGGLLDDGPGSLPQMHHARTERSEANNSRRSTNLLSFGVQSLHVNRAKMKEHRSSLGRGRRWLVQHFFSSFLLLRSPSFFSQK